MAKIIHTADIHLDSTFTSLSPDVAKQRRAGQRTLVSKIIDIANEENVDAIIIAGDLFDSYPIYTETAESLLRDFSRTRASVFITPGNHDPYTFDSPYKTLNFPENVYIFTENTLTSTELPSAKLRIFGAAYASENLEGRILKDFKAPDDDFTNIVILHSHLSCTEKYCPVSVDEISGCGADFVALGHIHMPTEIRKAGRTCYAYCGIPEARDFCEAHATGFYIGEIHKGYVNLEHRTVSDIRYRDITVDIEKTPDIKESLPYPASHEHLRLTLKGECKEFDAQVLYRELSSGYDELIILDETIAPQDMWQGIGEETLRGIFLRKMKERLESCEDERERQKIRLATKLGIDAIENRDI